MVTEQRNQQASAEQQDQAGQRQPQKDDGECPVHNAFVVGESFDHTARQAALDPNLAAQCVKQHQYA